MSSGLTTIRRLLWAVAFLGFAALAGCGGNDKVGGVEGVVTLDGNPLADATVTFQPEKGRPSTATTDAKGHYSLQYNPTTPGAEIGKHTVRITTGGERPEGTDGKMKIFPEVLPPKYHQKSELQRQVKQGRNQFDFELKTK